MYQIISKYQNVSEDIKYRSRLADEHPVECLRTEYHHTDLIIMRHWSMKWNVKYHIDF